MQIEEIKSLIEAKGATLVSYTNEDLLEFSQFFGHFDIAEYLRECQTKEDFEASGVYVAGDIDVMMRANFELAPGALLFPHGFLSIASDVGGNEVCVDVRTGYVYFASHSAFDEDMVYSTDENTGELIDLAGLEYHNILRGLVVLSDSFERFLTDLLNDRLTAVFEDLD